MAKFLKLSFWSPSLAYRPSANEINRSLFGSNWENLFFYICLLFFLTFLIKFMNTFEQKKKAFNLNFFLINLLESGNASDKILSISSQFCSSGNSKIHLEDSYLVKCSCGKFLSSIYFINKSCILLKLAPTFEISSNCKALFIVISSYRI